MSPTPVIDLIRTETGPLHDRLERRLDVAAKLDRPEARRELMLGFFSFYAGVEDRLDQWLGAVPGLDYAGRRKLPALARDLETLGVDPAGRAPANAPELACAVEAMGFQYVLEGSTLGGQIIRREAEQRGLSLEGLTFFDVYGAETGRRWRAFREALEQWCAADPDAAARGARRGFEAVEAWLCEEAPA